ncbi:MerR family transcriptional regulator, partial [Pseudomonas aeruginosa]|uniref:MerR family transcriptional regulator n=1 Tax=Pseudomonas aeruginosa TaxID=287 RepID=UPI001EEF4C0A|nr:MerR family transcriptional regulator [Pseudomonas aeruginosa]
MGFRAYVGFWFHCSPNPNVETIRYYQRRGLLDEPAKPLGGHRRYPVDMVKRLRFIKRAQ